MPDVRQQVEAREDPGSLVSTWRWLSGIFSILLSVGVVVSLIKSNAAIDLHGIPAKAFAQYAWFRDVLFEPAVWALRYFSIAIETWVKDFLLGYGLIAGATVRAYDGWVRRGLAEKGWMWRLGTASLWPLAVGLLSLTITHERNDLARKTHKGTFTLDGQPYDQACLLGELSGWVEAA